MRTKALPTRQRNAVLWALASSLTLAAAALSVPPLRRLIEQSMVWHMVLQMPLLMLAGWVAAHAVGATNQSHSAPTKTSSWNQFGLTGGLAALVVLAYWMLPSSLDRALVDHRTDTVKLASLWLCGAMLRHSAARAPLVVQLFFVGTALPMLVWAGLYFASTDLRLCNAYSLDSQIAAGQALAGLAAVLALWWTTNAVRITRSSPD